MRADALALIEDALIHTAEADPDLEDWVPSAASLVHTYLAQYGYLKDEHCNG